MLRELLGDEIPAERTNGSSSGRMTMGLSRSWEYVTGRLRSRTAAIYMTMGPTRLWVRRAPS